MLRLRRTHGRCCSSEFAKTYVLANDFRTTFKVISETTIAAQLFVSEALMNCTNLHIVDNDTKTELPQVLLRLRPCVVKPNEVNLFVWRMPTAYHCRKDIHFLPIASLGLHIPLPSSRSACLVFRHFLNSKPSCH